MLRRTPFLKIGYNYYSSKRRFCRFHSKGASQRGDGGGVRSGFLLKGRSLRREGRVGGEGLGGAYGEFGGGDGARPLYREKKDPSSTKIMDILVIPAPPFFFEQTCWCSTEGFLLPRQKLPQGLHNFTNLLSPTCKENVNIMREPGLFGQACSTMPRAS